MEQLFQDANLQAQIEKDGVVTIPFLSAEEVQTIRAFYNNIHPKGEAPQMRDGIHMTIWCTDKAYKLQVKSAIDAAVQRACEQVFTAHRRINPVFITKRKGKDTTFPIHQDWSIVDETKHTAFNLWIPLHDVDETNGALWFVKGSHKITTYVRGPGVLFPNLYGIKEHVRPLMSPACVKAGTAVIFYHRVIHGSPPNQTNTDRIVAALSIVPQQVPLQIFFQKDQASPLEVYRPHDEFIYDYDNVRDDTSKIPPGKQPVELRNSYTSPTLTPKSFDDFWYGPAKPPSWLQQIKMLFNRFTN